MKILRGVISGFAASIIFILAGFILRMPFAGMLLPYHGRMAGVLRPDVFNGAMSFFITIYAIYLGYGMIIGLFYSIIKDSLPGKNFFIKGLIFGLFIWSFIVLMHNLFNYIEFRVPLFPLMLGTFFIDLASILISMIFIAFVNKGKTE